MDTEFCVDLVRAKRVSGWMSDAELLFLAQQAQKSNVIFEIGSYLGRSTRAIADNTEGSVHAIDSWNAPVSFSPAGDVAFNTDMNDFNIFYMNLSDHIRSGKVIPSFKNWEDYHPKCQADFIFIDGNHTYKSVMHDIGKALHYGTRMISGHDWDWSGVQKAVAHYFPSVEVIERIWYVQDIASSTIRRPKEIAELYQELTGSKLRL